MSYNIRYDNKWDEENSWDTRKESIVRIFEKYSPSFIGTQEGLAHQIHYMDSVLTKYDFIGVGREDGIKKGEFCAIYYESDTYNVIESSTFWLSDTPENVSIGWDAALERICTYGLFEHKMNKKRIWVFNTHFDHIGKIAREESSKLILKKIGELNNFSQPTILMGDLNSLPNSIPINTIQKNLKDAFNISLNKSRGPIGTYNGFNEDQPIEKRIDYIFLKNIDVLNHQHINDRLENNNHISDHLPVMVDVIFKP
jgi:endonuclease/exonuclease/phosphatase family metal-dependent hydrolase